MTLSDEMIEEAARAAYEDFLLDYPEEPSWEDSAKKQRKKWKQRAKAALKAVLPTLRKQVLEEAANLCRSRTFDDPLGNLEDGAEACEARIRSLMDKG